MIRLGDKLLVTDEDGEAWETTFTEFAEANPDLELTLDEVASLEGGRVVILGGGACPVMTIQLVPASSQAHDGAGSLPLPRSPAERAMLPDFDAAVRPWEL